mmetsp:Transcript_49604/g.116492  ORF Transcript_49604/g.116492 Transcript_49604/m.116492 type:complete len:255 (-) Transcript_49604:114-878(-)
MDSRRRIRASAMRSIRSVSSAAMVSAPQHGAPERDDDQGTGGGDEVVEQDAKALGPADRGATLGLEQPVRPAHGPGLGGVEEAKQPEGDELADEAGRRDQPQDEPEGQHLVPDDGARVGRVQVLGAAGAGPPADEGADADQQRPGEVVHPRRDQHGHQPGPQRADGAGRLRAQAAAKAQRDPARRVAPHEGRGRANWGAAHDAKWSKDRRPWATASPRASTTRRPGSASMRPTRVSNTPTSGRRTPGGAVKTSS